MKERFPLSTYLVLVGAMISSGAFLFSSSLKTDVAPWFLSGAGLLLFFFELRLMDEYKDFSKDQIAHPTRPLPRGLLSHSQVRLAIFLGLVVMTFFSASISALGYSSAAKIYLVCTIYLALMFKEFFLSSFIGERPFLYGVTHQVVLIPLMAFPVSVFSPEMVLSEKTLFLGITALGGFFTYELCRKLDPGAHPILKTYPQVYGIPGTLLRILVVGSIGILGATLLGVSRVCGPIMCLTIGSAILWSQRPRFYKAAEIVSTIGLLVFLGCIPIAKLLLNWS
ncbi:hypothetical protein EBZ37_08930 [bacterium]|nr:hypothetical protein [bacterium]